MKKYIFIAFFLILLFVGQKIIIEDTFKSEKDFNTSEKVIEYKEEENNEVEDIKKKETIDAENIDKIENNSTEEVEENQKYSNIYKLMIVAHPDDESYWGGAHLLEDDYLVVCITCGTVPIRVTEFKKAMTLTKDDYIMLGYPDLTNGKKDNWDKVYTSIKKDLEDIINIKQWQQIVTHNPNGEYGHIHHKMTSKMVTQLSNSEVLWYFGRYYSKEKIGQVNNIKKISDETKKLKINKLIPIYKSQKNAENMFKHMFDYENFVFNKDWNVN